MHLRTDKKVCVILPTFNNASTLASVIKAVSNFTPDVIIVNDGSTDNTLEIVKQFPFVHLVSYRKNIGKGFALRTGFAKAIELGFDYAITLDTDGQHFADDILVLLNKLNEHPNAIIMGARNMNQDAVPRKSSFGHRFSNFWFKVETGISLSDTQSGFRLYPIRQMKDIQFFTNKFEFEVEVLVRSAWNDIEVVEVPVKVFYPEKGKRISHFRPFIDFSRIFLIRIVLVAIAILYIHPRNWIRGIKKKSLSATSTLTYSIHTSRIK